MWWNSVWTSLQSLANRSSTSSPVSSCRKMEQAFTLLVLAFGIILRMEVAQWDGKTRPCIASWACLAWRFEDAANKSTYELYFTPIAPQCKRRFCELRLSQYWLNRTILCVNFVPGFRLGIIKWQLRKRNRLRITVVLHSIVSLLATVIYVKPVQTECGSLVHYVQYRRLKCSLFLKLHFVLILFHKKKWCH